MSVVTLSICFRSSLPSPSVSVIYTSFFVSSVSCVSATGLATVTLPLVSPALIVISAPLLNLITKSVFGGLATLAVYVISSPASTSFVAVRFTCVVSGVSSVTTVVDVVILSRSS
ncbi:hypothetical protein CP965_14060 [Halarcobacter mediterraneus]|uniref:Uncharacterized protein n=1 Tax=Halarcobacter mediterraneus TaxID=2023153 RepID=A0A4Q1APW8_9BACT|nr:hypothetical protein [Halarcobacter mediterraneus]RXK11433.1 hypothetical protein CP965_14060 [Halarcobacter mediterraneus]